jgi:hypothetical protein
MERTALYIICQFDRLISSFLLPVSTQKFKIWFRSNALITEKGLYKLTEPDSLVAA